MSSTEQWILLARVLRPQGRKGEVLADLFTGNANLFSEQLTVWLAPAGFTEAPESSAPENKLEPAQVAGFWLPVGRNAGRIVLHFAGLDSINQAEQLAGREVVIPASQRPQLEPGTFYISDLIGAMVFDSERSVGTIEDIEAPASADGTQLLDDAPSLLVVRTHEGQQALIPFVAAYLRSVDVPGRKLWMNLPAGLLELNRNSSPANPGTDLAADPDERP